MHISVQKFGHWGKFSMLAANLTKELQLAQETCLKRWALKAEGIAKEHISSQDLANGFWLPLAAYTIQKRSQRGTGYATLLETGSYLQSITSYVENDTAYVGVRRGMMHSDGSELDWIARINEEGNDSLNIPARPLWQPTLMETMEWHLKNNSVKDIFIDNVRKRYG
jgi:hypothetical protein